MKPLGEKLTSWNCAYYPGAKPGKKYALNKQYALLIQLRLITRVYGICTPVPVNVLIVLRVIIGEMAELL